MTSFEALDNEINPDTKTDFTFLLNNTTNQNYESKAADINRVVSTP